MKKLVTSLLIGGALLVQTGCLEIIFAGGADDPGYASAAYWLVPGYDWECCEGEYYVEEWVVEDECCVEETWVEETWVDEFWVEEVWVEEVWVDEVWFEEEYWPEDDGWYVGDGWYYDEYFDEWYFAAAVYDGDTVTTYLIEAAKAWEFGVVNSKDGMTYRPGPAYFGLGGLPAGAGGQSQWDGLLDDVQYYDYALTVGNIRYLFENPGLAIGAINVIPEPSTFLIWSLGLLGLAACARRRKK